MSYVDEKLLAGEKVVYKAYVHWIVYGAAIGILVFAVVMLIAGAGRVGLAGMLLAGLVGLVAFVQAVGSDFVVTNKRVLIKVGLLYRRSVEILLTKVEGIGVEQHLGGRILGYGTIVVSGTGGTQERFANIAAPFEFRKRVQEQAALAQESGTARLEGASALPAPPLQREERDCPYCAERILARARVCKHCGRDVQPLTA